MKTRVLDFKMECGELYVCCLVGEFGHVGGLDKSYRLYGETNIMGVALGGGKRGYVATPNLYHGEFQNFWQVYLRIVEVVF